MSLASLFEKKSTPAQEAHWIPLSDLMTGLMLMFLLISVIYMMKVEADKKKVEEIALIYDEMRAKLYQDLKSEFQKNEKDWGAEVQKDLTMKFKEPNVLFVTGKDELNPEFIRILNDFFPRYVAILSRAEYKDSIDEIRIEGHTSSIWNGLTNPDEAYILNMALSQARTRTTLQYALSLPNVQAEKDWLRSKVTANGLSSSKLVKNADGTENINGSQRVEFRIRTNAENKLQDILKTVQKNEAN